MHPKLIALKNKPLKRKYNNVGYSLTALLLVFLTFISYLISYSLFQLVTWVSPRTWIDVSIIVFHAPIAHILLGFLILYIFFVIATKISLTVFLRTSLILFGVTLGILLQTLIPPSTPLNVSLYLQPLQEKYYTIRSDLLKKYIVGMYSY